MTMPDRAIVYLPDPFAPEACALKIAGRTVIFRILMALERAGIRRCLNL